MGGMEAGDLTNDEIEYRNFRLQIENLELQKLIKLKEHEIEIVKMLNKLQLEIRAQHMICNSVRTDFRIDT
jgi:hypothetical protein